MGWTIKALSCKVCILVGGGVRQADSSLQPTCGGSYSEESTGGHEFKCQFTSCLNLAQGKAAQQAEAGGRRQGLTYY